MNRQQMLLVEDHEETRTLLRRIVSLCGWQVAEAATVAEGLDRLDPPPDCLVLDLRLPDGDGATVLRKVREAQLPTRVIINTAGHDPRRLRAVSNLKPDAILLKPLDSKGLRTICEGVRAGEAGRIAAGLVPSRDFPDDERELPFGPSSGNLSTHRASDSNGAKNNELGA
jgi:DNA-binding response OmpR family regulator